MESRSSAAKNWCFTINNPAGHVVFDLNRMGYLIYQEEMGENGTHHFQGYVSFLKKQRLTAIKKLQDFSTAHLEVARGTPQENIAYCSKKDDTYLSGPYEYGTPTRPGVKRSYDEMIVALAADPGAFDETKYVAEYVRHFRGVDNYRDKHRSIPPAPSIIPKDWQKEVLAILAGTPSPRQIYWYYDQEGGSGKTTFCKYLASTLGAFVVKDSSQKERVVYAYLKMRFPSIVLFDVTRDDSQQFNYSTLETLKDGIAFNVLYHPQPVHFATPHVIVFANIEPQYDRLSVDRWVVKNIGRNYLTETIALAKPPFDTR